MEERAPKDSLFSIRALLVSLGILFVSCSKQSLQLASFEHLEDIEASEDKRGGSASGPCSCSILLGASLDLKCFHIFLTKLGTV